MSDDASATVLGSKVIRGVIDPITKTVAFSSLALLDRMLRRLGFVLAQREPYGPAGGRQLFYQSGRVVVRIKTKGDAKGFRAGQPHLSVGLTDGKGRSWSNERAKFSSRGRVAAKALVEPERFQPIDFEGQPQRFVVIRGGLDEGPGPDAWAARTHFPFPPQFSDAGVDALQVGGP